MKNPFVTRDVVGTVATCFGSELVLLRFLSTCGNVGGLEPDFDVSVPALTNAGTPEEAFTLAIFVGCLLLTRSGLFWVESKKSIFRMLLGRSLTGLSPSDAVLSWSRLSKCLKKASLSSLVAIILKVRIHRQALHTGV